MFYDIADKLPEDERMDYLWEEVDGKPRYRWYKYALNSVYMIETCDQDHDIDKQDFSDLTSWYESAEWVALNDPEALVHIMETLVKPVNHLVKDKLIYHLLQLNFYKTCAIVKKHLRSHPIPDERTFSRKKKKAITTVTNDIVERLRENSEFLYIAKTKEKEKLANPRIREAFTTFLNIHGTTKKQMTAALYSLEWLHEHCPKEVHKLFSFTICEEIKDQFLEIVVEMELYKLRILLNETIKTHNMELYYKIPDHVEKTNLDELFTDPDFDMDDMV